MSKGGRQSILIRCWISYLFEFVTRCALILCYVRCSGRFYSATIPLPPCCARASSVCVISAPLVISLPENNCSNASLHPFLFSLSLQKPQQPCDCSLLFIYWFVLCLSFDHLLFCISRCILFFTVSHKHFNWKKKQLTKTLFWNCFSLFAWSWNSLRTSTHRHMRTNTHTLIGGR